MSQTILIEPNEDLRIIFSLNLTAFTGTDIIARKTSDDAVELLKLLPEVNLVIARSRIGSEETAKKIHNFLKSEGLAAQMIVLGNCPLLAQEVLCLEEPVSWELLIKVAAESLGVSLQHGISKVKPNYIPVGTHYFYEIQRSPCDVYIRIKKGLQEYQYVKRIHSKDIFDRDTISRYEEQGLKEFYISKDYIQYFTTFVTSALVQKLERTDLTLEDRILTDATGHQIVRETIQNLGLDEATIELSDASIKSMVISVKDSPQLSSLLKFLFSNKVSYAYQHCHLLALVCHYILSRQSWYKEEHLQTLSFASYFADLTLKSPTQMQIASLADLAESPLDDEERAAVLSHAKDAVEHISKHPELNDSIRTVIMQSHGKEIGIGFEDHPGESLHPLAKVFIIADNFIKILLNPTLPSHKKDILPLLYQRFKGPSYQLIIKALESKFQ